MTALWWSSGDHLMISAHILMITQSLHSRPNLIVMHCIVHPLCIYCHGRHSWESGFAKLEIWGAFLGVSKRTQFIREGMKNPSHGKSPLKGYHHSYRTLASTRTLLPQQTFSVTVVFDPSLIISPPFYNSDAGCIYSHLSWKIWIFSWVEHTRPRIPHNWW